MTSYVNIVQYIYFCIARGSKVLGIASSRRFWRRWLLKVKLFGSGWTKKQCRQKRLQMRSSEEERRKKTDLKVRYWQPLALVSNYTSQPSLSSLYLGSLQQRACPLKPFTEVLLTAVVLRCFMKMYPSVSRLNIPSQKQFCDNHSILLMHTYKKKNKTSWRFVAPHTEKPPGYDTLDLDDPPPQNYDAVVAAKANELAHGSLTGELIPTYRAFSSHGS